VLGKPTDRAHAKRMLLDLADRSHQVWTGLALMHRGATHFAIARTEVRFRAIDETEIERYLDHEQYQDKAGAYAIQGRAAVFVESINGCFFNVMGFPLNLFDRMLRQQRIPLHG
jgi:septum formation protein